MRADLSDYTGTGGEPSSVVNTVGAQDKLVFGKNGVCRVKLDGIPAPTDIETLIEDYVSKVELLPHYLKVILLDISGLVHMPALTRQVFSEFLREASHHYSDRVQVAIAAGPPMIRKYTEILCRALKFGDKTYCFETLQAAVAWLKEKGL